MQVRRHFNRVARVALDIVEITGGIATCVMCGPVGIALGGGVIARRAWSLAGLVRGKKISPALDGILPMLAGNLLLDILPSAVSKNLIGVLAMALLFDGLNVALKTDFLQGILFKNNQIPPKI